MPALLRRESLCALFAVAALTIGCTARGRARQPLPTIEGVVRDATMAAPSAATRPGVVPIAAQFVNGQLQLGDASPAEGTPRGSEDILYAIQCDNDVIIISTTRETLYAELRCATVLPDEAFRPYLSQPVAVSSFDTAPRQLHIASGAVGDVGFAVGGVWLMAR